MPDGDTDQILNKFLKPFGLWFPVDVSTSSRATIGGMTGNNSCGGRSIRYGMMRDNVLEIEGILSDGSTYKFGDIKDKEIASSKELAPQIINNPVSYTHLTLPTKRIV